MKNVVVFINVCILAMCALFTMNFNPGESENLPLASTVDNPGLTGENTTTVRASAASMPTEISKASETRMKSRLSSRDAREVENFIQTMRQERLLDFKQAQLAVQRGTLRPLKDYASWMTIHQQRMLEDIDRIAKSTGITISEKLDPASEEDFAKLEKLHGQSFDNRFIKGMTTSLKRDLKVLERASYSPVPEVQVFAARYTTITKDNLAKIQNLRKTNQKRKLF